MRNGKASSATGSLSAKRSPIRLIASASGERNHAFASGNTGLPNSRWRSANHGPANNATAAAPASTYANPARRDWTNASGSNASAKIAFEYLSAAAAPRSAPASAARRAVRARSEEHTSELQSRLHLV